MARKRHTEEQIIAVLKEAEAGVKVPELCRKYGLHAWQMYKWRRANLCIGLATAGILVGCGQYDGAAAGSAKVVITPPQATIKPLGRQRFSAVAEDAGGNVISDAVLQWRSTDPGIVSVDATGLATGLSEGTAQVGVSVSERGPGVEVSPTALASLRVTQNAARPIEIMDLQPFEDQVVYFLTCRTVPCPLYAQVAGVGVDFLFSSGDVAESAKLIINNADATRSAHLISQRPAPFASGEGQLFYVWSQGLPAEGTNNVMVELRSKQGRLVSYSWSFTVIVR